MYMLEHTYWLRNLDPAHNNDVFEQLKAYWATNNYTLRVDQGPQPVQNSRMIVARNAQGFNMSLIQGAGGPMSLHAQSPCVYLPDPISEMKQPTTSADAQAPSS
jgi:hypothetical protein